MDENDRFGIPEEAFLAAYKNNNCDKGVIRLGMDVPTRGEVSTLPITDLEDILIAWMWESPSELIPSRDQIREIKKLLEARPDASDDEIVSIIKECQEYIEGP